MLDQYDEPIDITYRVDVGNPSLFGGKDVKYFSSTLSYLINNLAATNNKNTAKPLRRNGAGIY